MMVQGISPSAASKAIEPTKGRLFRPVRPSKIAWRAGPAPSPLKGPTHRCASDLICDAVWEDSEIAKFIPYPNKEQYQASTGIFPFSAKLTSIEHHE